MLADDRRSWQLGSDATWRRTEEITGVPARCDTHQELKARALAADGDRGHAAPAAGRRRLARPAGLSAARRPT